MGLTVLTCLFAAPLVAQAHVKWFTDFSFTDPPLTLGQAVTPTFLMLALLTFLVMGALVFGRTEIIGHTILHAALIVFLLEGPGRTYPAPINIHQRLPLRIAFAAVNFLIVVGVLLVAYSGVAQSEYRRMTETAQVEQAEGTSP
jgi:hypothetical protein